VFIFLDTETTSTGEKDRLCQLAYKTEDGDIVNELFKPPLPITIDAMCVHHITNEMVMAYGQTKHQATIEEFKESIIKLENHLDLKFLGCFSNKEKFNLTTFQKIKNNKIVKSRKQLFKYSTEFWRQTTDYLDYFGFKHK